MVEKKTNGQKIHDYVYNVKPILNKGGLFADGSKYYVSPQEPDVDQDVNVRFRTTADNVDEVFLIYNEEKIQMTKESSNRIFDFYTATIPGGLPFIRYHFEIHSGRVSCFYDKLGPTKQNDREYDFEICPGFKVPEWAKGAVFYQIFVDRFCNGDTSNDVLDNEYAYIGTGSVQVKDWNQRPSTMDVGRFYGGDLQGVKDKLDYLQDLGIEVVYFNPLFVSPSNHKYDIQDYDYIDPHYGKIVDDGGEVLPNGVTDNSQATKYKKRTTGLKNLEASNELFIKLVEELHRRGMKVILDGVFNHCGSFNKWMDRERIYEGEEDYEPGAYVSADSPYRSYFRFFKEGPENWPYNANYDGWWGHDTLPKLNYEDSVKLENYILYIGRKWVSPPYNVDGWRLDVAADLGRSNEYNHEFWQKFRRAVKDANPNALILAEHYGDPSDWLKGDEWDTVMNYDAFMEPVTWFLTGMEKHSDEYREDLYGNSDAFIGAMKTHMRSLHMSSLHTAMNELSNHDHSRFLTRTNHRVGRVSYAGAQAASENINTAIMREAIAIQMTWPGAPTLYYGDEAGVCGFTDPDNRRTYPWGHEDMELLNFYKVMIAVHKKYKMLRSGSLKFLWNDYQGLCYARFSHTEQMIIVLNNRDEGRDVMIEVWPAGISRLEETVFTRLVQSSQEGYTDHRKQILCQAGSLNLYLPPCSVTVLHHKDQM